MIADFAIVAPPPDLADALGVERVLVEAVEMHGDALFRGAYRTWEKVSRSFVPGEAIPVTREQEDALVHLFCEARRLQATDDVTAIRDADYRHSRDAARPVPKRWSGGTLNHRARAARMR